MKRPLHGRIRSLTVLCGLLLAGLPAAGCDGAGRGPETAPEPRASAFPAGPVVARARLAPGELVIVDADAGPPGPDDNRLGVLLVSDPAPDGGFGAPELLAADPGWSEPVEILLLSPTRLLLLESKAAHGDQGARGGLDLVDLAAGTITPWWRDPRLRQPVGLARTADGHLWISDRTADPLGLDRTTGAVFELRPTADPADGPPEPPTVARVIAGPELVTPGCLLATSDGRVLLMDADANPHHYAGTPGVLFSIGSGELVPLLEPEQTTSPLGLIERSPGEIFLIDCNEGRASGVYADGALFRVEPDGLVKLIDSYVIGRPQALHDPTQGDVLPDGRLVVADVSADPLGLGADGSQGFMGSGPGAILVLDPDARTVDTLIADSRFVSPFAVHRVRR